MQRLLANNQFVPYHLDVHNHVLQVPLNDNYKGGKLVVLNENGTWYPPRPIASGTLIDASRLVHGVSKLTRGVRYGLYLMNDPTLPQECILSQELNEHDEAVMTAEVNGTEIACELDTEHGERTLLSLN